MDVIYASSVLTIVAACGNSADASLPGLRPGSRTLQVSAKVQGIALVNVELWLEELIAFSVYGTSA